MNVSFWYGTFADYNALQEKDPGALYFITDKNVVYMGTTLMTDRYTVEQLANGVGIRLTDKLTGQQYNLPNVLYAQGLHNDHLTLRYHVNTIHNQNELVQAMGAEQGIKASGAVEAGTVFRIEGNKVILDPIQDGESPYVLYSHDLLVALHDISDGKVESGGDHRVWDRNNDAFMVIPSSLVDLIHGGDLDANKLVVGNDGPNVKTLPFAGAGKILRTNANNNAAEWVSPETVQNVIVWEQIPSA